MSFSQYSSLPFWTPEWSVILSSNSNPFIFQPTYGGGGDDMGGDSEIDWDDDKCPVVLKTDNVLGRYLAASRLVQPGEIILREKPIIVCPNAPVEPDTVTCLGCCGISQEAARLSCRKCGWPICKEECEDIPDHANLECKIFAKEGIRPPLPSPYCFIAYAEYIKVLRCLLLRELGREDVEQQERWNLFKDFEAHLEQRKSIPKILVMSKLVRNFVQEVCKLGQFEDDTIDFVLGAIDVNAFGNTVMVPPMSQNGMSKGPTAAKNATVLYKKGSLVAHGCRRNTQSLTFANGHLEMRAGARIPEQVPFTHAYVDLMLGTSERRRLLREQFYFDCACDRCSDPTELGTYFSALKCQQCEQGYLIMDNPLDSCPYWKCTECTELQPTEYEKEVLDELREEERKLIKICRKQNDNDGAIQGWNQLLDKYRNRLHENHYALLQVQLHLIRCMAKVGKPSTKMVEDMQRMIDKHKMLYSTFYPMENNK